jgi:hypothetical protein
MKCKNLHGQIYFQLIQKNYLHYPSNEALGGISLEFLMNTLINGFQKHLEDRFEQIFQRTSQLLKVLVPK